MLRIMPQNVVAANHVGAQPPAPGCYRMVPGGPRLWSHPLHEPVVMTIHHPPHSPTNRYDISHTHLLDGLQRPVRHQNGSFPRETLITPNKPKPTKERQLFDSGNALLHRD